MATVGPWRVLLLVAAAAGGAALVAVGCQPSATVTYAGEPHPHRADAEELARVAAGEVPDGYDTIGVITARCTTVDGATGLLDGPCTDEALVEMARERAAAAGGTALQDLRCNEGRPEREVVRRDGGVETTVRATRTCRATVLRGSGPLPAPSDDAPLGRRITLGDVPVAVRLEGGAEPRPAREPADVGVLDTLPEGTPRLGRVHARCLAGCARATARRALRHEAARVGALAVGAIRCERMGDRWRCTAEAVGPAPTADRPRTTPEAEPGPEVADGPDAGAAGPGEDPNGNVEPNDAGPDAAVASEAGDAGVEPGDAGADGG